MNDLLDRPIPGNIIGYLESGEPVRLIAGASDDDDDDGVGIDLDGGADPDADDVDDDDDDIAADEPDEKPKQVKKPDTPAVTQADIDALREAQAKRNREHRQKIRELQAQLRDAKRTSQKTADGADDETEKAIEAARAEAEKRFKPIAIRNAAKAGFLEAGLNDLSDSRMKKLIRMLDMDDIEVDEDGEVVGLDDQIDAIKEDWPELFRKPQPEQGNEKPRIRAPKGDAADRKNAPQKPRTTGELYAQQLLGR